MPWTWAAGGLNNNYQYGIYNPGIQGGILDGTSPVVAASDLTQGEAVAIVYQSGTASTNYPLLPLVDAEGDQTSITGRAGIPGNLFPNLYMTPSSYPVGQPIPFNALVTDAAGTPMANVPVTLDITGANPQQLQATTDSTGMAAFLYSGSNAGTDTLEAQALPSGAPALLSSQSSVTWVNYATPPAQGTLQLNLLAYENNEQGYDVLATDASGAPVFNANVGLHVWGIDNFIQSATTDITGHAEFTYYHSTYGRYNLVAVESTNRNVVFSNVINGQWNGPAVSSPSGQQIVISLSGNNTVTMPNTLQLNATVTDGAGLTPTVVWSQVSGPGTVTFANPNSILDHRRLQRRWNLRAATERQRCDRQQQLGAVDGCGVSSWARPAGMGGKPAFRLHRFRSRPHRARPRSRARKRHVTYYPANNSSSSTVLNADTTGTGQIGTLDTTMLANGSYWIQLQATDMSGQQQYSLVLVTVAGNYKPGRVTATVTDLVVPATGLAINIQRTYDSLNAGTSGDFGLDGISASMSTSRWTPRAMSPSPWLGSARPSI